MTPQEQEYAQYLDDLYPDLPQGYGTLLYKGDYSTFLTGMREYFTEEQPVVYRIEVDTKVGQTPLQVYADGEKNHIRKLVSSLYELGLASDEINIYRDSCQGSQPLDCYDFMNPETLWEADVGVIAYYERITVRTKARDRDEAEENARDEALSRVDQLSLEDWSTELGQIRRIDQT